MQELIPETGVDQVSGSVFRSSYIKVYVFPVFVHFRVHQCFVVVRVHVAQIVCGRTGESRHGVQFQREDGNVVDLFVFYRALVYRVPRPFLGVSQWRFACFGGEELVYFRKFQRQTVFVDHVRHSVFVVYRERFPPVALA